MRAPRDQRTVSDDQRPDELACGLDLFRPWLLRPKGRKGPRALWRHRRSQCRRLRQTTCHGSCPCCLAPGRALLAWTRRWQHLWTHHGAITDLALQILGVVQVGEGAGRLLRECRQAGELAQHGLLALVQQLRLTTQLLLPPGELCWVRSLMAAACFFAVAIRASAS